MTLPPMGVTIYGRPQGGTPGAPASLELVVHHPNGGRATHRVSLWDDGERLAHQTAHEPRESPTRGVLADWVDENQDQLQAIPREYRPYVGQLIRRGHRWPPEPPRPLGHEPTQMSRRRGVRRYADNEHTSETDIPKVYGVWNNEVGDDRYAKRVNNSHKVYESVVKRKLSEVTPGEEWPFPPVVVRRTSVPYELEDGNHRLETARRLGMRVVPAVLIDEKAFGTRSPVNTFVEIGADGTHKVVTPNDPSLPPIRAVVPPSSPEHLARRRSTAPPDRHGFEVPNRPDPARVRLQRRQVQVKYAGGAYREEGPQEPTPPPPTYQPYAWPGGYPLVHWHESSGTPLCADCANQFVANNPDETLTTEPHYEGPPEYCEDCGTPIQSAYGDPDEPEEPATLSRRLSSKIHYAAYRAPAGGMVARGTSQKGGQFVPDMDGEFMRAAAKLTAPPRPDRKQEGGDSAGDYSDNPSLSQAPGTRRRRRRRRKPQTTKFVEKPT